MSKTDKNIYIVEEVYDDDSSTIVYTGTEDTLAMDACINSDVPCRVSLWYNGKKVQHK